MIYRGRVIFFVVVLSLNIWDGIKERHSAKDIVLVYRLWGFWWRRKLMVEGIEFPPRLIQAQLITSVCCCGVAFPASYFIFFFFKFFVYVSAFIEMMAIFLKYNIDGWRDCIGLRKTAGLPTDSLLYIYMGSINYNTFLLFILSCIPFLLLYKKLDDFDWLPKLLRFSRPNSFSTWRTYLGEIYKSTKPIERWWYI